MATEFQEMRNILSEFVNGAPADSIRSVASTMVAYVPDSKAAEFGRRMVMIADEMMAESNS